MYILFRICTLSGINGTYSFNKIPVGLFQDSIDAETAKDLAEKIENLTESNWHNPENEEDVEYKVEFIVLNRLYIDI